MSLSHVEIKFCIVLLGSSSSLIILLFKVNGVCCHNEENLARHGASNERFEFNNFTRIIDGTNAKPGEFPYMV